MSEILKNKLWVAVTNSRTLETTEKYEHSYACADHCLIISPEQPEGFEEVDGELAPYLGLDDWGWLWAQSVKLRQEQEKRYAGELRDAQNAFLMRFETALEAARTEGLSDGEEEADEPDTGSAAGADETADRR